MWCDVNFAVVTHFCVRTLRRRRSTISLCLLQLRSQLTKWRSDNSRLLSILTEQWTELKESKQQHKLSQVNKNNSRAHSNINMCFGVSAMRWLSFVFLLVFFATSFCLSLLNYFVVVLHVCTYMWRTKQQQQNNTYICINNNSYVYEFMEMMNSFSISLSLFHLCSCC